MPSGAVLPQGEERGQLRRPMRAAESGYSGGGTGQVLGGPGQRCPSGAVSVPPEPAQARQGLAGGAGRGCWRRRVPRWPPWHRLQALVPSTVGALGAGGLCPANPGRGAHTDLACPGKGPGGMESGERTAARGPGDCPALVRRGRKGVAPSPAPCATRRNAAQAAIAPALSCSSAAES